MNAMHWHKTSSQALVSKCGEYAIVPLKRLEDFKTIAYDAYKRRTASVPGKWYLKSWQRHHIGRAKHEKSAMALCEDHREYK